MRKSHDPGRIGRRYGDIRKDLSHDQLASIGSIALAYNEVEFCIDQLFFAVTRLDPALQLEVCTRINGIDGKIAIIKSGAAVIGLNDADLAQLSVALGEEVGCFGSLKKYRDAVIHSRLINSIIPIGMRTDRRAKLFDVLLTMEALDYLYQRLVDLRFELEAAKHLLLNKINADSADPSDRRKEQLMRNVPTSSVRFRKRQDIRQSRKSPPEFPSELELRDATDKAIRAEMLAQMEAEQAMLQARAEARARRMEESFLQGMGQTNKP